MNTLAFDCSGETASVALVRDAVAVFEEQIAMRRGNSGQLHACIQQILQAHGNPDRLVVGLGPGSFSGIRMAVATAVGLRLSTRAITGGLPSIAALDVAETAYHVIGDIRQGSFFFATVADNAVQGSIEILAKSELLAHSLRHPCYTLDQAGTCNFANHAKVSAGILARQFASLESPEDLGLKPLYLRPAHVTAARQTGSLFKTATESSESR